MIEPGKHKLTEALQGQAARGASKKDGGPPSPSGRTATPRERAEEARRAQEARPDTRLDRDERLTHVGRGQQTHG